MCHIQLQTGSAKQSQCVITSEEFAPFYIPPGHVTKVYSPKNTTSIELQQDEMKGFNLITIKHGHKNHGQ